MGLVFSHSYEDPNTGEPVDVMVDDGEDDDDDDGDEAAEHRNARPARGKRRRRGRPGRRGSPRPRPRPGSPRPRPRLGGIVTRPRRPEPADDGYFRLKKEALIEVIPLAGKLWSSFLGQPDMPPPTGDDITDRGNAALHRDALAKHQQAQHRIEALSEIAARALDMVMD